MKRSLAHLPRYKKEELKLVIETIRKLAKVEMIILFGSHCGDHWVENDTYVEDNTVYTYRSDFDILIVVKTSGMVHNINRWEKLDAIFVITLIFKPGLI